MLDYIKSIQWKPLGAGALIGAALSNEFTVDLLVAVIRLATALL